MCYDQFKESLPFISIVISLGAASASWVALFKERIFGPEFAISADEIRKYTTESPSKGAYQYGVGPIFFRAAVSNLKPMTARNVEAWVMLVEQQEGGSWRRIKGFVPTALCWTHVDQRNDGGTKVGFIGMGQSKPCDLGVLEKETPTTDTRTEREVNDLRPPIPKFRLSLSVRPTSGYDILRAGSYRLTLSIGAENAESKAFMLYLTVPEDWQDVEDAITKARLRVEDADVCTTA